MDVVLLVFSLFLAALLGFAAHRASVCTVKAVAEVFSTGRAAFARGPSPGGGARYFRTGGLLGLGGQIGRRQSGAIGI